MNANGIIERFGVRTVYGLGELALMLLVAIAAARLIWAVVEPVGPIGEWAGTVRLPSAPTQDFSALDGVFGISASDDPVAISQGDVELFGVRMNLGSGRGGAILQAGDDPQASFRVGEEIAPGITLFAVAQDHVILERGGARERLYLDQSAPAERVAVRSQPPQQLADSAATPADAIASEFSFSPRLDDGEGVSIRPAGAGQLFRQLGLRPGDILMSVDGSGIANADAARNAIGRLVPGDSVAIVIERGETTVPVTLKVPG
ncbi:MAG: type II secretion system protein N [Pacificimonas sp.]